MTIFGARLGAFHCALKYLTHISETPTRIRNMRVSKLPPIRPSRYGRENGKCWSQIALAAMREKGVPGHPVCYGLLST